MCYARRGEAGSSLQSHLPRSITLFSADRSILIDVRSWFAHLYVHYVVWTPQEISCEKGIRQG